MPTGTEVPWTGLLLAGGRSRRMGQDKARLDWRGQSLLSHQRELLRRAGAARVLVSGDYPEEGGIPDRLPGRGPLGGLHAVTAGLDDGPLLILPIDMPNVAPEWIAALARHPASCAHYLDHVLPMRLALGPTVRAWLAAALRQPSPQDRSLRALHAHCRGELLPLPPGAAAGLANCNTPEDWRKLLS